MSSSSSSTTTAATSATTSTSTSPPPPAAEAPRPSWGDIAEEDDNNKLLADLNVEDLSLSDPPKSLDEPDSTNIEAVTSGDTPYTSAKRFEDLNLSEELLKGLYLSMKFERPSRIQAVTLPMILSPPYKNLIAQSPNGSGKTICFVLGMLSRVDPELKAPQALCVVHTRELVHQNMEVLKKMGKYTGITAESALPDTMAVKNREQITAQVIIGTTGTLKKLISFGKLFLNHMKILVFDEADHMLAGDGFRDDSMRILNDIKRKGAKCQVLLFSATFNEQVKDFVGRTMPDHNQLFVKKEELSLETVKQYKVYCPDESAKVQVIKDKVLELGEKVGQTIIFVRTRNSAGRLHEALVDLGYEVTTIQGALTHEDRDKIVKEFKDGLTKVLISTDLLARGFDQSQVNVVINYDLPFKHDHPSDPDYEVYLHRVGRAGRFGRNGAVFNLLSQDREYKLMQKIEDYFQMKIAEVPSWNSDDDFQAALREAKLL
ncbi:DEAD-box ATP-dependent RNA helicase 38-like protein [Drosera capensis]